MSATEKPQPLLKVTNMKKHFPLRGTVGNKKRYVYAVQDVSFELYEGEVYGLVGESGCGKSTTGRTLLRLTDATDGTAEFLGKDIFKRNKDEMKDLRRQMQMVFQDPFSSLNPRIIVGKIIEEPLVIHNIGKNSAQRMKIVIDLIEKVGLKQEHYYRYPHEFSGGQRQRIGLARALAVNPKIIVCDEPVSALDVSIQSQVINLLEDIRDELNLTYLFIAHDLSVVRHISDRIGVMYMGHLVEEAVAGELFENAKHPYTQALLSSIPIANPKRKKEQIKLKGEIPSVVNPPSGCVFHTRCPMAIDICKHVKPEIKVVDDNHSVACHLY